jgi:hypothetical protein
VGTVCPVGSAAHERRWVVRRLYLKQNDPGGRKGCIALDRGNEYRRICGRRHSGEGTLDRPDDRRWVCPMCRQQLGNRFRHVRFTHDTGSAMMLT